MGRISSAICFMLALLTVLSIAPPLLLAWACEFSSGCIVGGFWKFLIGPGGVHLSSGAMVIGMDPLQGHDKFRFCRPSTRPGLFKIKALVTVQDPSGKNPVRGWLPVTRFRLH